MIIVDTNVIAYLYLPTEFTPDADILTLVKDSACSAYDCEFVSLARNLNTILVTTDRKIFSEFPNTAKSFHQFLR
jgi:hypothetical protein